MPLEGLLLIFHASKNKYKMNVGYLNSNFEDAKKLKRAKNYVLNEISNMIILQGLFCGH